MTRRARYFIFFDVQKLRAPRKCILREKRAKLLGTAVCIKERAVKKNFTRSNTKNVIVRNISLVHSTVLNSFAHVRTHCALHAINPQGTK